MADLVDTNVLVYRYDERFPDKQARSIEFLKAGIEEGTLRLPHQAIVEFMAVVTRPGPDGRAILPAEEARREVEELLVEIPVLYPKEEIVRIALWGSAAYGMSWYDAHLWAYAEFFGLPRIWSEDFQHDRQYGTVRVTNPFLS
ncbi:MAG TPA: PIN domain-containing protein [Gemmatimonadota bacterium]|nr:PIN domain-containing protein [Gemmatimonadota bacterium]